MNRRDRKRINKEPRAKRRVTDDRLEPLPGDIHTHTVLSKEMYCDFILLYQPAIYNRGTEALLTHLRETSQFVHSPVETVYIGGGTPQCWERRTL